jgi:beta-1,4-N-acetylglucosaminyltransferase
MLLLLRDLDTSSYTYRRYIVSSGDSFSAQKAADFEKQLAAEAKRVRKHYGAFDIKTVTRARNIHQSLLTTPLSAMICIWDCLNILRTPPATTATHQYPYPNLIMANGPATATVMIFAALVLRVFGLAGTNKSMRCIYVESWARVKTASLSGKILSITGVCDRLLVQWAALSESGFEFRGQLVA